MEFRDLKRQYERLKVAIDAQIEKVISSAHFISGEAVGEIESALAEYVGVKYCISCGNGTDAISIALLAHNVGSGDAVFVPDFTFFSSGECPAAVGATPVFVDVRKDTYNLDVDSLERAVRRVIKEGKLIPRAVIAVDLFGLPFDYETVRSVCNKYDLLLVEDAAQGFGGVYNGRKACSLGDISTTSFFPAKPLGCYGDGGAIFTDDVDVDARLRSLRASGKSPEDKYDNREVGMNSRLDTLQAAILLPKFKAFVNYELKDINNVASIYENALSGKVLTPEVPDGFYSSWAQYTILLDNQETRSSVQKKLKEHNIPSMIYYPRGLHQQAAFAGMNLSDELYPNTIEAVRRCLSLPIHPYMKEEEQKMVISVLLEAL